MVKIWDYVNSSCVKLTTKDGKEFQGKVICVDDMEEDEEATEDSITLKVNDQYIGFNQSEIDTIEEVY